MDSLKSVKIVLSRDSLIQVIDVFCILKFQALN